MDQPSPMRWTPAQARAELTAPMRLAWFGVIVALVMIGLPPPASALPTLDSRLNVSDEVVVDSADQDGATTTLPLVEGKVYEFRVSGTYTFDGADADAECAQDPSDPAWLRDRFSSLDPHVLDVLVDGVGVEWTPTLPDPNGCNTTDHTYRYFHVAPETARVNFSIRDHSPEDNVGALTVEVLEAESLPPGGTPVGSPFQVQAADPDGEWGPTLSSTSTYRIEVVGTYTFGVDGVHHDAECLFTDAGPGLRLDELDALGETPDLWLNGSQVNWASADDTTQCSERTNSYVLAPYTPVTTGQVNLRVNDTNYADNTGEVTVRIFELSSATGADTDSDLAGLTARLNVVDEVRVNASNQGGASTKVPLEAGRTYRLEASGTYRYDPGADAEADPECAQSSSDDTFLPSRFASVDPHVLDLLVNGTGVDWTPTAPDVNGCNGAGHTYELFFVPEESGFVNFRVNDLNAEDNEGTLTVRVYFAEKLPPGGTLVGAPFTVFSNHPGGAESPALQPDRRYRIEVTGTFAFGMAGTFHDAECLYLEAGGPGLRLDPVDVVSQAAALPVRTPDLLVNGAQVNWTSGGQTLRCSDRTHTYQLEDYIPDAAGPVHFVVGDAEFSDNVGQLTVRIYEMGLAASAAGDALADATDVASRLEQLDRVRVPSSSEAGASTVVPLVEGRVYELRVSGTYRYDGAPADGECAALPTDPTLLRDRFSSVRPHLLDVLVNGVGVEWTPTVPDVNGCNSADHTYTYFFTPETTGTVNFRVDDPTPNDNDGELTVDVFFAEQLEPAGTLVGSPVTVRADDSSGAVSSEALSPVNAYRIEVTGTFTFGVDGTFHDAECLYAEPGGPGQRTDVLDTLGETPDLLVNGDRVNWTSAGDPLRCSDRTHTYTLDGFVPSVAGPAHFVLGDREFTDNVGELTVRIFELS